MAEVYALYSGRDGKVRYVGQTSGSHQDRFKEHQRFQYTRGNTAVYSWIHGEWYAGYPVKGALLERCDYEIRLDVESKWIGRFPNLLNERKLNYHWHGRKPPVIAEIKEYMSGFIFNVSGFHGIHYWRDLDRYSVFVYLDRFWMWLPGDGAPGWTGDIWFSDFAQALDARERCRQRLRRDWPRDVEQEAA